MSDPAHDLRELANRINTAVGQVAEAGAQAGLDEDAIGTRIGALLRAQKAMREAANEIEAHQALTDVSKPFCLTCRHHKKLRGGITCSLGQDTKEANTTRRCALRELTVNPS